MLLMRAQAGQGRIGAPAAGAGCARRSSAPRRRPPGRWRRSGPGRPLRPGRRAAGLEGEAEPHAGGPAFLDAAPRVRHGDGEWLVAQHVLARPGAAITCSACRAFGVAMYTASTAGISQHAGKSSRAWAAPWPWANSASARPRSRLTTLISVLFGAAAIAGAIWVAAIRPGPTMPQPSSASPPGPFSGPAAARALHDRTLSFRATSEQRRHWPGPVRQGMGGGADAARERQIIAGSAGVGLTGPGGAAPAAGTAAAPAAVPRRCRTGPPGASAVARSWASARLCSAARSCSRSLVFSSARRRCRDVALASFCSRLATVSCSAVSCDTVSSTTGCPGAAPAAGSAPARPASGPASRRTTWTSSRRASSS